MSQPLLVWTCFGKLPQWPCKSNMFSRSDCFSFFSSFFFFHGGCSSPEGRKGSCGKIVKVKEHSGGLKGPYLNLSLNPEDRWCSCLYFKAGEWKGKRRKWDSYAPHSNCVACRDIAGRVSEFLQCLLMHKSFLQPARANLFSFIRQVDLPVAICQQGLCQTSPETALKVPSFNKSASKTWASPTYICAT